MGTEKIDDILQEYEEGLKKAMICASSVEVGKNLTDSVRELKYAVDVPVNVQDAFEKLRFNQYDLILIDENYSGNGFEGNEFLKHIQQLPMTTRRYIFVALFGANFKTMDNMSAFEHSVNLVVNEKDLSNIRVILKKTIADNEQFYKVFKESLQKYGKM